MDKRYRLASDDGTTFETDDVRAYNRKLIELGADLMGEGEQTLLEVVGAMRAAGEAARYAVITLHGAESGAGGAVHDRASELRC